MPSHRIPDLAECHFDLPPADQEATAFLEEIEKRRLVHAS